jgi:hypothetical protein
MPNARFLNMFGIREVLRRDYEGKRGIKSRNKDRVVVITGYEGTGKSNLGLQIFEEWRKIIGKPVSKDDIRFIASNKQEYVKSLDASAKYDMVIHDEAGKDLYARNALSSFNKDLNIAYQVIREKNLYTILIIPSIIDLDTFFRRRRVTAMLHVYKEGRVAYFSKHLLRQILPAMVNASKYSSDPDPLKMRSEKGGYIYPNFFDTFKMYNGVLLEGYQERKTSNIQNVIDTLMDKYGGDESIDDETPKRKGMNVLKSDERQLRYDLFKRLYESGTYKISEIKTSLGIKSVELRKLRARYVTEDLKVREAMK